MAKERMTTAIHGTGDFEGAVLRAQGPVLVDFWARWCGPCRALAPALDELARELAGRARIVKVDVDENPDLAREYDVSSIPCLVIFRDGREVNRLVGLTPKDRIADALEDLSATVRPAVESRLAHEHDLSGDSPCVEQLLRPAHREEGQAAGDPRCDPA